MSAFCSPETSFSNSTTLTTSGGKSIFTIFTKSLIPWKHYVPVFDDYSNLEEILLYLKENDVIHIRDDKTGIEGNFRIIGKSVTFGPNQFRLQLTINQRPPILAQFLT